MRPRDGFLLLALLASVVGAFLLLRGGPEETPSRDDPLEPIEANDGSSAPKTAAPRASGPDPVMETQSPSAARPSDGRLPDALKGDASIAGRVESGGGEPVAGATVHAGARFPGNEEPDAPAATTSATTGSDGRFRFDGLAKTRWAVRAEKEGYGPAATKVLDLSAGAGGGDVTLRLATLGWIVGEVFDGEERWQGAARVAFARTRPKPSADAPLVEDDAGDGLTVTAEVRGGAFRTVALPAGSWELVGFEGVGDRVPEARATVIVADGQASQPLVIRLTTGSRLLGEVVDAKSGAPLAGATVDVLLDGNPTTGGERRASATTDRNGRVDVQRLAAGSALVRASAEGRAPEAAYVELPRGGEGTRVFRLDRPAELRIRVLDDGGRPIAKALVGLDRDAGPVAAVELPSLRRLTTEHYRTERAMPATGADGTLVLHVSPGPIRVTAQRYYGRGLVAMTDVVATAGEAVNATVTITIGK